jgi:hypothetical protein
VNNNQLYLSIGIPSLLVILAWISNRADSVALRAEMIQLRKDVSQELISFRDSIHRDIISLHERVAVVETRQQSN